MGAIRFVTNQTGSQIIDDAKDCRIKQGNRPELLAKRPTQD
jgi:hypothetical protein